MSAAGDLVDVKPALAHPVKLFHGDGRDAWGHLADHVCNHGDEWTGWCLLLPTLEKERVGAGDIHQLREQVRTTAPERARPELQALYRSYLGTVHEAIEKGVQLDWYWTERRQADDTCWHTFSSCGVRGVFDEEVVRTGHLPRGAPYGQKDQVLERYNLFLQCLRKIYDDYKQAVKKKQVVDHPAAAFQRVMSNAPSMTDWQAF